MRNFLVLALFSLLCAAPVEALFSDSGSQILVKTKCFNLKKGTDSFKYAFDDYVYSVATFVVKIDRCRGNNLFLSRRVLDKSIRMDGPLNWRGRFRVNSSTNRRVQFWVISSGNWEINQSKR